MEEIKNLSALPSEADFGTKLVSARPQIKNAIVSINSKNQKNPLLSKY